MNIINENKIKYIFKKFSTSKNDSPKLFPSFIFSFKFFSLTLIIFLLLSANIKNNLNYKIVLCTVAKEENKYIKEYIDYYLNYGVNKIYIYDNNDRKGERFDKILSEYINNNTVKIINIRGKKQVQVDAFNHCSWINFQRYNWMLLFDVDEFIFLKNYTDIKDYLKEQKFDQCKAIFLNELVHTDNDQIFYQNKSVIERFPEININRSIIMVKSILKGKIKRTRIVNNHVIRLNWTGCDGSGKKIQFSNIHTHNPDFKNYFFAHYFSKSSEEYLWKIGKGSVFWGNLRNVNRNYISMYFDYNKLTKKKINYFENKTGINLSFLRDRLKNSN